MATSSSDVWKKPHHVQLEVCINRPSYRDSREEKAVKVYTVNQESCHILVFNIPSLGITKDLLELFSLHGEIEEYRLLDEYPSEEFTDVCYIKYKDINSARTAKKQLDNYYFFSQCLHVCYAPEFESVEDTRYKLNQRRFFIEQKTKKLSQQHSNIPSVGKKSLTTPQLVSPSGSVPSVPTSVPSVATCVPTSVPSVSTSVPSAATSVQLAVISSTVSIPSILPTPPSNYCYTYYPSMYNDTTSCYSKQTLEHQSLSDSVPVKKKFNNPCHKSTSTLPTEKDHGTTQLSHNSGVPSLTECCSSFDTTIETIRSKMTPIFHTNVEIEQSKPKTKKRKRI